MRFLPANKILGNLDYNFTFLKFFKEINKYGILMTTYWKFLFCPEILNLLEKKNF